MPASAHHAGAAGPVTEVAAAVGAGRVTRVAAVTEALLRIERLDGDLNTVVALRSDEALAEAAELDRSGAGGRLAGVPVLVKDLEDVRGMPTRKGSLLLADAPAASRDGLVPERLRAAGAVVVGKSALPEFAVEGYTANLLTGVTRNPWDLTLSPGGSSGGSAAAVAAGLVPVATATDGGGSIRIPAASCGLVGIKPTRGLVPRRPVPDWIDLSTDGPLATTVGDLRLLLDVESGAEVGDPEAFPGRGLPPAVHPTDPGGLLVAERISGSGGSLPPSVASAFEAAVAAFADLVGVPAEVCAHQRLHAHGDVDDDWTLLCAAEHVSAFGPAWVREGLERMHPSTREFLAYGLEIGVDEYLAARRRRFEHARVLDELLGGDRLLLLPTVRADGFLADGRAGPDDPVGPLPSGSFATGLQNLTGHPAVTLPAGRCERLPFGLQVTGPRYADCWLLDIAARWEAAYPWPRTAPGYRPFAVL
jgi:Asp-tRNA(Asn)/Glu-tRNA(Gln) amidotransferase A subunit family amidase